MDSVVLLTIVFVAVAALGVGSLTNIIALPSGNVQQLGVGETKIVSPVKSVDITARLHHIGNNINFKDLIESCVFHSPSDDILTGSTLICKLVDINDNIIAEGRKKIDTNLPISFSTVIPITDLSFPNANNVMNIHDIIFVVQGP